MKKNTAKAALRTASSGARFASDVLDLVDNWASRKNHPEWYENYPLDGLTNLNFGRRETIRPTDPNYTVILDRKAPLDAVIEVELTKPVTDGEDSAFDEACGIILNQMRAVATTTAQYTKSDIKRYMENVRITAAAYAMLRRLADCMGLADTYDSDAYYKYALMHFPFYTKWASLVDERAQLNAALAAMTPVLRNLFPAKVDVVERMFWMFSNIFVDSPSKKFSTKMFKAENWAIHDASGATHIFTLTREDGLTLYSEDNEDSETVDTTVTGDTTAFGVTVHVYSSTPLGLAALVRAMIALIIEDPMASKIAGDLLKAFGQDAFITIPPYEPNKQAPFVYDEDVLNQVQNITCANAIRGYDCDGDQFVWNATANYCNTPEHAVTTYRDEVPGARAMAITRLSAFHKQISFFGTSAVNFHAGTEVVNNYFWVTSEGTLVDNQQYLVPHPAIALALSDVEFAARVAAWSSDDWAPITLLATPALVNTPMRMLDLQNWAVMNMADQRIFTNVATLSLYCIPYLVKKQDTFAFVR